jgi:hypothetical protein
MVSLFRTVKLSTLRFATLRTTAVAVGTLIALTVVYGGTAAAAPTTGWTKENLRSGAVTALQDPSPQPSPPGLDEGQLERLKAEAYSAILIDD